MRYALTLALVAAALSSPARADSFEARAQAFFATVRESPSEYNCRPAVCRTRAARRGLVWHDDFRVCDADRPALCAYPRF